MTLKESWKRLIIDCNFMEFIASIVLLISINFCAAQKIQNESYWINLFDKNWKKEYKKASPLSKSGDSWKYYNLAYYIDANNTMFEITNDEKYLKRSLEYVNNMIESARVSRLLSKSQYKDNFMAWSNYSAPGYFNDQKEYPLFESYCWRYITAILVIMKEKKLTNKYSEDYIRILNFSKRNIYYKWMSRGENNLYRSNAHMSSHWVRIAADLYLLTNEREYIKVIEKFMRNFNENIENSKTKQGVKYWKSVWSKNTHTYQDVSHGNAVVSTLVYLDEKNILDLKDLLNDLTYTFKTTIWKNTNTYSKYVDGSDVGTGWFSDGYVTLGRFDKELQKRFEKHKVGRSTQFYAQCAKNALLLNAHE